MNETDNELPNPVRYTPFRSGRYSVAPNLRPLDTDFGNGPADRQLFQFDREFVAYRENKLACRRERLDKYVPPLLLTAAESAAVTHLLLEHLTLEHPARFDLTKAGPGAHRLCCRLTGESLLFDESLTLGVVEGGSPVPAYRDSWDALGCQVQEDLAVVRRREDGSDQLVALHICAPSVWRPGEKLGHDFRAVHAPVPGMESSILAAPSLIQAAVERGPFVRFVWGLSGSDRLNQHPDPPPGIPATEWRSPTFRPGQDPPVYVRIERQVLWGIPEANLLLFAIRLYRIPAADVRREPELRAALAEALVSMPEASRIYKGVAATHETILNWLTV